MRELVSNILKHVLSQIEEDKTKLLSIEPISVDWHMRTTYAANETIPKLVKIARKLLEEVQTALNSPGIVRERWHAIREETPGIDTTKADALDEALRYEQKLLTEMTGEIVSECICGVLCEKVGLTKNNRSTYPDLYWPEADYRLLPKRTKVYPTGPAKKGKHPSNIPDGLEVKSQRRLSIRVDSHHPHQGMHLVVTFGEVEGKWACHDLWIAYLSQGDYTQATRKTTATTEKFSFGGKRFVSVLTGRAYSIKNTSF